MAKLFDRVKVNIATTGTGTVTFGSASSNAFLTPTEAGCLDGDTVRYVIVDGTDFEEGIGTIASTVATMERTTVTKSKIGGTAGTSKIDLSGTAVLALTASAADIVNTADVTTVGNSLLAAADAAAARAAIDAGIISGFRNKIINGNFTVNQRSGTKTPGVGVYGYDRWKGHANGLEQVIEALEAGEYTLTWTGGGTGTFAGTTSASPFKATSAGGNVSVIVPSTATRVSLVPGDATAETDPFSPRHIQQEAALCRRYYQEYAGPPLIGIVLSGFGVVSMAMTIPQMRAAPTLTIASGIGIIDGDSGSAVMGSVNSSSSTDSFVRFIPNLASGSFAVAGRPVIVNTGVPGKLVLDSEL